MFYALNNNVYLVKGKVRSCIYDFNTSMLYSINDMLSKEIEQINSGNLSPDVIMDNSLKNILCSLVEKGLIILLEHPVTRKIEEIQNVDRKISFAWIEITNKCNLKCRHCYNESGMCCDINMSLEDYKLVIDNILKLGIRRVQIIGGEPFVSPIMKNILDYTIKKFDFIEIFTNGTLISQKWYEYFLENDIHIALSVYSYDEGEHDKITGCKGSWRMTNKTIEGLKSYGIPYRVCNVLMKDLEIGNISTDLYRLNPEKDIVRMSGRASFDLLSDELIRKKLITKKTFQKPIQKLFCSNVIFRHNCFGSKLYVAADLSVYPCVMERRIKHCDLKNEQSIVLDEKICSFTKDKINECCDCEYRYACFDCRPNSLSGNVNEKPWFCTYNPLEGRWENEEEFIKNLKYQQKKSYFHI